MIYYLKLKEVLSPGQIAKYDEWRGYTGHKANLQDTPNSHQH
ncbi:hypothetical protein ACVLD2_002253 [Paenibacillus sp. PvR052]|nr:hypothetical protein [Paenibacillus sp. PvP091]MBP1171865.1 hypothetical protein [Paenibacillus sp. PvR098]MBP2438246.1 hypothetical protein [Paenibacillus sp. PvP052]